MEFNRSFICWLEVYGPSWPKILDGGPSGWLNFVLHALRLFRSCDPRNNFSRKSNTHIHILDWCAFALDSVKLCDTDEQGISGSRKSGSLWLWQARLFWGKFFRGSKLFSDCKIFMKRRSQVCTLPKPVEVSFQGTCSREKWGQAPRQAKPPTLYGTCWGQAPSLRDFVYIVNWHPLTFLEMMMRRIFSPHNN